MQLVHDHCIVTILYWGILGKDLKEVHLSQVHLHACYACADTLEQQLHRTLIMRLSHHLALALLYLGMSKTVAEYCC